MRIGVDLGGTKIELAALGEGGRRLHGSRCPTPAAYDDIVAEIAGMVAHVEQTHGAGTVGVGIPGTISPATGLVKGSNSLVLNGRALDRDLGAALSREVRVANDANCFALSEAVDGAGADAHVVFGVIIGTGCGGGVVVGRRPIAGRHSIAGEWGHMPLPWPKPPELPLARCWCGRDGCMELYVAGPALAADCDGPGARDASALPGRAAAGDAAAQAALDRHVDRLARGLAVIADVIDPDVIVLGGGLSNMAHLYDRVPAAMAPYVFSDAFTTPVRPPVHGDSSGVRGAAWLWPD